LNPRVLLLRTLAGWLAFACACPAAAEAPVDQPLLFNSTPLMTVIVTGTPVDDDPVGGTRLGRKELAPLRARSSDSTQLLHDVPGVSVYSAGAISGLPVIHGLADDRLRVQVDGMDLMSACPNHMNSVLSYIDPSRVAAIEVFAGIAPVSVGGDSIGGAIQMKSAPLKFARADEGLRVEGQAGAFYRSNGNALGYQFGVALAGEQVAASYSESNSQSDNYEAAGNFKLPGLWQNFGEVPVAPEEVGSSAYKGAQNRALDLAFSQSNHLVELGVSEQKLDYEGFPNQRMDMVSSAPDPADPTVPGNYLIDKNEPANVNRLVNLRYTGQYDWGQLEAQVFRQSLQHHMDMLPDRFNGMLMPMDTESTTLGGQVKGSIELSETDTLRVGGDFQKYRLDDWWPPIGGPFPGSMCCQDFWNINDGERDRLGLFAEWEARWNPEWLTLAGIRSDTVEANTGPVQGYSSGSYQGDANRFNALDHQRVYHNWDWTLLTRYTPSQTQTYEAGLARKTRAPNLYELYPWSTFAMAALMNNFVGDGNGYIGNLDLKPEVAHTISATADWHDAEETEWSFKATGYATWVEDFINAKRCGPPVCNTNAYLTTTNAYVLLQYDNQSARLYGFDLSGHLRLGRSEALGSFTAIGLVNYVRGESRSTGDNLYHMMPLNAKLGLEQRLGRWTNAAEVQGVAAKTRISQVRNEVTTPGYALFNLRSSYEWKHVRLDVDVENVFDTLYLLPLGGAYLGQGNSMTTGGVPWGMSLPGRARSLNVALNMRF
jgi:iron complex outermembrane receptor protein